jgi:hypothetical protein
VLRFGATASRIANLRENVAVKKRVAATSCENGSLPSAEALRTAFLFMEAREPRCLSCADLDHLLYQPRGDTALIRRACTHSSLRAHGSFQLACRAMNVKGIRLKRPLMARLVYSINF